MFRVANGRTSQLIDIKATVTYSWMDRSEPEREVRREAWENYADAHLAVRHSQAAMYATMTSFDDYDYRDFGSGSGEAVRLDDYDARYR